jgi:septation ring formation regulator EzrA
MWKQIYEWLKDILTITRDTQENRAEIKELRKEIERLTNIVQHLAFDSQRLNEEIKHIRKDEAQEREKLILKLENELLKSERRKELPAKPKSQVTVQPLLKVLFVEIIKFDVSMRFLNSAFKSKLAT